MIGKYVVRFAVARLPRRAARWRRSATSSTRRSSTASARRGHAVTTPDARARAEGDADPRRRSPCRRTRSSASSRALVDRSLPLPRSGALQRRRRPAAGALAGRRRPRAAAPLRTRRLARRPRHRVRAARRWCSRRSSSRCRSSCARWCRCCARSAPSRSRRPRRWAPRRLQTFRRVTWPAIRWATAYGVVLTTARALGEFGAVSVVSGRTRRRDRVADPVRPGPLPVVRRGRAYASAVVLALIAVYTLILMTTLKPKEETR